MLYDSIRAKGPISVAHYMNMCLSHPIEGYYMKGEPIGARGDFITSPEISQLFGELVGIWLASQWLERGQSRPIRMVELGPGKGTLMDDMLRTFESIGQTRGRIQSVHLVETSARLQEEQRKRLGTRISETLLHWHNRAEDIPKDDSTFTLLVAHEFFDAIPIHIIEKTSTGFQEVLVDIDRTAQTGATLSPPLLNVSSPLATKSRPSTFRYVISGPLSPLAHTLSKSSPRFSKVPNESRIEVSPASWSIARTVGELVSEGGAGLVIDYGDDRAFGSSFRAFQKHKLVDVFDEPGLCDLTANVDFAYLKEAFGSTGELPAVPLHYILIIVGG
ncbi:NADH dehydrogenase [ubiquinone] complex I, assembly factor 7 [Rhizoctonia solani]|uniref:Protein arginine methyltransferase NDUFAF7 n=1 Tax=Rhizoctonia solani TaxID=456999 RepID=A0A0K6FQM8_9AGAM|nr:NADH dehydrogenase [ubiquinone] complex I, assembly factor 7 [Rhizoctonia solani]